MPVSPDCHAIVYLLPGSYAGSTKFVPTFASKFGLQLRVELDQVPERDHLAQLLEVRHHDDVVAGVLPALQRGTDRRVEFLVVVDVGPVRDVDAGRLGERVQGGPAARTVDREVTVDVRGPVREVEVVARTLGLHVRPPLGRALRPRRRAGRLRLPAHPAGRQDRGQAERARARPRVPEQVAPGHPSLGHPSDPRGIHPGCRLLAHSPSSGSVSDRSTTKVCSGSHSSRTWSPALGCDPAAPRFCTYTRSIVPPGPSTSYW